MTARTIPCAQAEHDQRIRVAERERTKQHRLNDAEDGGGGADGQRQHEQRDSRKPAASSQRTKRHRRVLHETHTAHPPEDGFYCGPIAVRFPRSTYFWILPVAVFGSSVTNVTDFGVWECAMWSRELADVFFARPFGQ